ncbi:MAG: hypothetical protein R3E02_01875 [Blastomonas sp.]
MSEENIVSPRRAVDIVHSAKSIRTELTAAHFVIGAARMGWLRVDEKSGVHSVRRLDNQGIVHPYPMAAMDVPVTFWRPEHPDNLIQGHRLHHDVEMMASDLPSRLSQHITNREGTRIIYRRELVSPIIELGDLESALKRSNWQRAANPDVLLNRPPSKILAGDWDRFCADLAVMAAMDDDFLALDASDILAMLAEQYDDEAIGERRAHDLIWMVKRRIAAARGLLIEPPPT